MENQICGLEMLLIHRKVAVNVESCDDFPGYGDEPKSIVTDNVSVNEDPQFNWELLKEPGIPVGIRPTREIRKLSSRRFGLSQWCGL